MIHSIKGLILIIVLFILNTTIGQQVQQWIDGLENPKYPVDELHEENFKSKYLSYDFSTLLIPRQEFLGYIGSDYRRIRIYYTSVFKDTNNPEIYRIIGISVVLDNVCDFQGTITVEQVREYKTMHFGVDDKYKNSGFKSQGLVIGKYEFREDPGQYHSGIFSGIVTLYWYTDKYGILHYDDLEFQSDRFKNNQYVGTWSDYGHEITKPCNWGEYRIPFSGDLDIGSGFFSPNPKYFNMGWEDLKVE
ncbi:MAG: hypothetical protein JW731_09040 [Bacteroidales bacterium]|nr:hypothetical protein [Bacteroidales bacterium]